MKKVIILASAFVFTFAANARAEMNEDQAKAMGLAEYGNAELVGKWVGDHPSLVREGDFGAHLFTAAYDHLQKQGSTDAAKALVTSFISSGIRAGDLLPEAVRLNHSTPGGAEALKLLIQTESSEGDSKLSKRSYIPILNTAITQGDAEAFRLIMASGRIDLGKKGSADEAAVLRTIDHQSDVASSMNIFPQDSFKIMKTIVANREALANSVAAQSAIDQLKTPYQAFEVSTGGGGGFGYAYAYGANGGYQVVAYSGVPQGGYGYANPVAVVVSADVAKGYGGYAGVRPVAVYPSGNDQAIHLLEQSRDANMFQATNTVTSGSAKTSE